MVGQNNCVLNLTKLPNSETISDVILVSIVPPNLTTQPINLCND